MIHHYTTIETLALILKNKSIRFNRLDKVDDLEEGNTISSNINLSKYTFISCWTESIEENIPLWKLYANGTNGVRISLEKYFFEEYEQKSSDRITVTGEMKTLLPLDEYLYKPYMFITTKMNTELFYKPVEYLNDLKSKIEKIANFDNNSCVIAFGEVGKYKHERWRFQNESRFVLTAIPKMNNIDINDPHFSSMIYNSIKSNIDLPFDDYYLKIKNSALDKLIVTLCPSATDSQNIIVQSLIDKYAPKAIVKNSSLKGCVRLK